MKKLFLRILRILTFTALGMSIVASLIDTLKYSGFLLKYILVGPIGFFVVGMVSAFLLVGITKAGDYWWKSYPGKIAIVQSKILLPVLGALYAIFLFLEDINYPNFVFSKYHLVLNSLGTTVLFEIVLFFLPLLGTFENKYIRMISTQLKLSKLTVVLGLILLLLVCLAARVWR